MGLRQLRRHVAITTGNFRKLFGELDVPPLPVAVARLVELSGRDDAELSDYADVVRTDTALAAKVLRLVNSAAMGVRHRVTDIDRAVGLVGMNGIRSIALAFGVLGAVPRPKGGVFDAGAFWQDSLRRALVARALARRIGIDGDAEAFAGALLADLAVPVLLDQWADYYVPLLAEWRDDGRSLAEIEQAALQWNHAEAGAWIARSWGLPDATVCAVGLHHAARGQLVELELDETPVAAVAAAAGLPSLLRPDPDGASGPLWSEWCEQHLQLDVPEQHEILSRAEEQLAEIGATFGV